MRNKTEQKIGFGGGCHWCTEAVFQSLKGVNEVKQGFIRSTEPHDTFSEAAELEYDASIISLKDLILVHLATHASTSDHSMRGKYRSAVYVTSDEQGLASRRVIEALMAETDAEFVTSVLTHEGFKPSDERFHNYYGNDSERPFCKTYIDPKLAKIRQNFPALMK